MSLAYDRALTANGQRMGKATAISATSWRTEPLPEGWGAIRYAILVRDPVCRWGIPELGEPGLCGQPSTEVDHIGAVWDHSPDMLRGICHSHHVIRSTAQGRAAIARMRSLRIRPAERHPGYVTDGTDG